MKQEEGLILIISAPSGAGKTTLCRELLKYFPEMRESVSYTTRLPRPGEVDGKDYIFVSSEEFQKMVDEDAFAEWAEVHGNLYGTDLKTLDDARNNGIDLILDIDCQGARKLKDRLIGGCYVFVLPPSITELKCRLENRSLDAKDAIERRIRRASEEIKEALWYDYIIINDSFEKAFGELISIINAYNHRTERMIGHVSKLFDI